MTRAIRRPLADTAVWGWVLAIAASIQSSSYSSRPPHKDGRVFLIEYLIPYPVWAGLLALVAVALVIGVLYPRRIWPSFVGHVTAMLCYGTFAASTLISAILYHEPWAGIAAYSVLGILHIGRAIAVGDETAQTGGDQRGR